MHGCRHGIATGGARRSRTGRRRAENKGASEIAASDRPRPRLRGSLLESRVGERVLRHPGKAHPSAAFGHRMTTTDCKVACDAEMSSMPVVPGDLPRGGRCAELRRGRCARRIPRRQSASDGEPLASGGPDLRGSPREPQHLPRISVRPGNRPTEAGGRIGPRGAAGDERLGTRVVVDDPARRAWLGAAPRPTRRGS